ncbi:MAG: hypothetical protein ACE5KM_07935 [Planctomycetaceae bacterium]
MRPTFCLGIAILVCATTLSPASAAPKTKTKTKTKTTSPIVIVAHKGGKKFLTDIEAILKLTSPEQQKQWKVLKAQLDIFLRGVDPDQPLRMDIAIPEKGPIRFRPAIPVTNMKVFTKQNLKPSGVTTIRQARDRYKCVGNVYKGYMRHWKNKQGVNYAVFGETLRVIREAKFAGDPRLPIKGLLAAYDMAMTAENQKTDAKSIAARRSWVRKQAKELLAAVKKKDSETKDDFALRKLMLELEFEEAERFYAETAHLQVGWNIDLANMTGRFDLDLTPIEGTDLAKAIDLLGAKPSHFASVPKSKDAILSLRIHHPLDDLRKKNALRFFTALYDRQIGQIKVDTERTKAEKKATIKTADLVLDMMKANLKAGLFDVFAEVRPNKDKHTVLAGFATADGREMIEILKLLPSTNKGVAVAIKIARQGDVDIHKVTVKATKGGIFDFFVGGDTVYVGTSKEAVWFASGPQSLPELTGAIKKKANPPKFKADDPFLDVFVKVAPWLELMEVAAADKGDPRLRKLARDAFKSGNDGITLQLRRKKNKVVGNMDIQTDVLRFVGAMTAKFSQETLDDSNPNRKKKLPGGIR